MKKFKETVLLGLGAIAFALFVYVMLVLPELFAYHHHRDDCGLSKLPSYGEVNCVRK